MKSSLLLFILFISTFLTKGQENINLGSQSEFTMNKNWQESGLQNHTYPISKFAISFNPLGFFQYGPTLNSELGITNRLAFHVHVRFISLGLLSSVVNGHDNLSGIIGNFAFGCGPVYFFGKNKSKPYLGIIVDGNKRTSRYTNLSNLANQVTTTTIVYTINSGYRFRFNNGLFLNTGSYFGAVNRTSNWDVAEIYSNGKQSNDITGYKETETKIILMIEFSIGFEF